MIKFIPVSDRNSKAFIETAGARLKLVVTYAPTENADESEYPAYLTELAECTRSSDQTYYEKILILGDLNAANGLDLNDHVPRQIGKAAASDESSRNGFLLAEFVTEQKLRVENNFFLKSDVRKCTWRHPRTKELSLKNYPLTKLSAAKHLRIRDVRSSWEDSLDSDHAVLIVCIEKWPKMNPRQPAKAQKLLNDVRSKCISIFRSAPELD